MNDQNIQRNTQPKEQDSLPDLANSALVNDQSLSLKTNRDDLSSFSFLTKLGTIYSNGEFKQLESFILELSTDELRVVLQQAIKYQETISPGEDGERPLTAFMERYFASSRELLPAKNIETLICEELRLSRVVLADTCQEYCTTQAVIAQNEETKVGFGLSKHASLVEMRIERKLRENAPAWKELIQDFKKSSETNLILKFRDGLESKGQALLGLPEKAFGEYEFNADSLKQVASYLTPVLGWTNAITDYLNGAVEIRKPVESSVLSPALQELVIYAQSLGLELKLVPIKKDGLYSVTVSCNRP